MRFSIGFCAQMLGEYKGGGVDSAVNCNQLENEEARVRAGQASDLSYFR